MFIILSTWTPLLRLKQPLILTKLGETHSPFMWCSSSPGFPCSACSKTPSSCSCSRCAYPPGMKLAVGPGMPPPLEVLHRVWPLSLASTTLSSLSASFPSAWLHFSCVTRLDYCLTGYEIVHYVRRTVNRHKVLTVHTKHLADQPSINRLTSPTWLEEEHVPKPRFFAVTVKSPVFTLGVRPPDFMPPVIISEFMSTSTEDYKFKYSL